MSSNWVYYEILAHDIYAPKQRPDLLPIYEQGISEVTGAHLSVHNKRSIAGTNLMAMGKAELQKELMLLRSVFGTNLNIDLSNRGSIQMLIETINACLNLKSVFERNRALIKSANSKEKNGKAVFSYFNSYLLQAFDARISNIRDKVISRFVSGADLYTSVHSVIEDEFNNKIVPDAINRMLNAGVEKGVDDKYLTAYKEVLEAVNKMPNNPLTQGLKRAWGIDKLINAITKEITDNATSTGAIKGMFKKYGKNSKGKRINSQIRSLISKTYTNNASGLSLESMRDQIVAMVTRDIPNFRVGNDNIQMLGHVQGQGITGVGGKNMRPDGVVIFNANSSRVEQEIRDSNAKNRGEAVNLFNSISDYVEKFNDGFIVYENSKNYMLGKNFMRRGGFSAGEALSLREAAGMVARYVDTDDLITVLINAGAGGLSPGNTGEASTVLAQAIAYVLFDDWNSIGHISSGGQAIHILSLNGVLIPLSTFLYSLGQAIADVQGNPSSFVSVNISPTSYDTSPTYRFNHYPDHWIANVNKGLDQTKISYHFFAGISQFLP